MSGKNPSRSMDDIDETVLNYAEVKAIATGNPLIKRKMELDLELQRLQILEAQHRADRYSLEDAVIKKYPARISQIEQHIKGLEADITCRDNSGGDDFIMSLGKKTFTERKDTGELLLKALFTNQYADKTIGFFKGFEIIPQAKAFLVDTPVVLLKGELTYKIELSESGVGSIARIENHLMDTTLSISDGIRNMGEVYEEQKDKVDEPDNIWHYEIAFTERTITPCTITIEEMRERMKSGDVDFIKQHIRRFDRTDHWGGYSKDFDSLFTQACQMPKGDNQMLEAVTEVYRRHYYSGHSDYNTVKDAVIQTMNKGDFKRFKMIFDNLPSNEYHNENSSDYKHRIIVEAMKHGGDAYALYGLKNGIKTQDYPWLLTDAVMNRCPDCRDFLITTGIDYKDKEQTERTVALLYQAAKNNDAVMLNELKRQGVSMNYDRSRVFFICLRFSDSDTAAVLIEHGGDFNKFKNAYTRSKISKYDDGAEFFKAVENGGVPEATGQDEDEEFEQ